MKVILLRDVAKIGKRFEIKEVPDGYAQNKLIPQKDAEPATPANVKRIEEKRKKSSESITKENLEAKEIVAACVASPLAILMEANEQGHLFQGVHAKDVVAAASLRGLMLSSEHIIIKEPIKSLGQHRVSLQAGSEVLSLPIEVVAKVKL